MIKGKWLIIASFLLCGSAWATDQQDINKQLLDRCIASNNTQESCQCTVTKLGQDLNKEEWELLINLEDTKSRKTPDLEAVNALQTKMNEIIKECGATN